MKNQELRTVLHEKIDKADKKFLYILYAMTEAYTQKQKEKIKVIEKIVKSSPDDLDLITTKQLQAEVKKSQKITKTPKSTKQPKRLYNLKDLEINMEAW